MFLRLALCFLLSFPTALLANDWDALRAPGAIALMRHALAPGGGDPDGFTLGDCRTQRNLSDQGRDQARRIGAALRAEGIAVDAVWASEWCRSFETAELVDMGAVEARPMLNSFFGGRGDRQGQTADTIKALSQLSPDARVLLVSHQVNITALTGVVPRSGEIIVAQRRADGTLEVSGRVNIAP